MRVLRCAGLVLVLVLVLELVFGYQETRTEKEEGKVEDEFYEPGVCEG